MPKWIFTTLKLIALLCIIVVGLAWAVLATAPFNGMRTQLVERVLSEQIGQPFVVDGDVWVSPGLTTQVHISGAHIPSNQIDDMALAELNLLELEIDIKALLAGRINLDNLVIDGLQANLVTLQDGTTSWKKVNRAKAEPKEEGETAEEVTPASNPEGEGRSIRAFISDKTVTFTDIGLLLKNDQNGFVFDFAIQDTKLQQLKEEKSVSVTGQGSVNGTAFELEGIYPKGQPFTNLVTFGDMSLSYDGTATPLSEGGGHTAKLALSTGEIGELFDVLGLKRSLEGSGEITAQINNFPEAFGIADLDTRFQLKDGREITVTGGIEDIRERTGLDITAMARLYPEGEPPAPASSLKELKLTDIEAHIVSQNQDLEFEKLEIGTNAFEQGLDKVGPISIGRIYKTENATLGLENIDVQVGPVGEPYLIAAGDVGDLFTFKEVAFKGQLNGSMALLLKSLETAEEFGRVTATFEVSDAPGHLALTQLSAQALDTELWALDANLSVEDVTKLTGLDADLALGIADSADFLSKLGVEEVDVGALDFSMSADTLPDLVNLDLLFQAGQSDVATTMSADLSTEVNVIRGSIVSQRIQLEDLRDGVKALMQLKKATSADKPQDTDEAEAEPEEEKEPGVFNLNRILTQTDLEITLDLLEFVGPSGTSAMTSLFVADQGKLQAGPLELYYGGGHFNVTAAMDAVEEPDTLKVEGSTTGWDFGEILDAVGVKIDARGQLGAWVNVAANISSKSAIMRSMAGDVTVSMGQGYIGTSLIELAGLGIFPWLVSEELANGRADVTCVRAPVRLGNGKAAFNAITVETDKVQLVAKGEVDLLGDTISVRAEPRRVGKPLSRSAWPFDVTGKLSEPKFKLDIGGSRSKRADGADQMPTERKPCVPDIYQLK